MGGTSTYGYQTADGKVHYCVYADYMLLDFILREFEYGGIYQIQDDDGELITVDSLEEYYNMKRYEEEDSTVRGVYRKDGVFEYRYWTKKGRFEFHYD